MMQEKTLNSLPGIPMLLLSLAIGFGGVASAIPMIVQGGDLVPLILLIASITVALTLLIGLYKVEPNQSAVLSLFGKYVGTNRRQGLHFNNPFYTKKKISLRVRN